MRLGPEVDLILIPVVAEEQHLAAVGDEDQRIVGQGHGFTFSLSERGERGAFRAGFTGWSQLILFRLRVRGPVELAFANYRVGQWSDVVAAVDLDLLLLRLLDLGDADDMLIVGDAEDGY